jgi:hypothetical protein
VLDGFPIGFAAHDYDDKRFRFSHMN